MHFETGFVFPNIVSRGLSGVLMPLQQVFYQQSHLSSPRTLLLTGQDSEQQPLFNSLYLFEMMFVMLFAKQKAPCKTGAHYLIKMDGASS